MPSRLTSKPGARRAAATVIVIFESLPKKHASPIAGYARTLGCAALCAASAAA